MKTVRLVIVTLILLTTTEVSSQVIFDISKDTLLKDFSEIIETDEFFERDTTIDIYDYILIKFKGKGSRKRFVIYYANKDFTKTSKKFNYYIKDVYFKDHIGYYSTETIEFGKGQVIVDRLNRIMIIDKSFNKNDLNDYKYAN